MSSGAVGFMPTDSGFTGGVVTSGKSATYSVDLLVTPQVLRGTASFSLFVGGNGILTLPAQASMRVALPAARFPTLLR